MEELFLYGNSKTIDLHGYSKEDARAELLCVFNQLDSNVDCIYVIHGYHAGNILKNFVRKEFTHNLIEKMIFVDAGVTAIKIKKQ